MSTINYDLIGMRIRKQRELLRLSREQLSEKLNISSKFLSDIELGVKGMSLQTLISLSQVLTVSTDYILFGISSNLDLDSVERIFLTAEKEIPEKDKLSFIINYIAKNFIPTK